ncbi:hypothetical protein HDF26_000850 [Pedobacter cryoconitis]|uniref:Uncharacterized protein n=1 Tax=Pedobacter cryoconitis TaxID=188932 RepID=A0A7W9E095_9SPHI|nr:hypothetical protein [Pedobacter cryoconitis]MBB5637821.1 hypothetical protein [Pedobacter cryoconitis]MBB6270423.1 hypothetical protein [Pedobacter cryoconitis]
MKIQLISYGDARYATQREFFKQTALTSSFFNEITIFSPEDIEMKFNKDFEKILTQRRGGGYWIWKPYFIKRVLETLADGDILIYCDAGCMINSNGGKRFKEYIDLLKKSKTGCISFELPHKEIEYTKQEVFDYFETPEDLVNSNQLMATVIMLKKCPHTVMMVNRWYTVLSENPLLFTDDKDNSVQNSEFIDHRHDQSIFSIVRKTYKSEVIPDETYFLDFIREGQPYPIWATRLK